MPTLLTILASPRGDYSISRALAADFTSAWKGKYGDGTVVERDLYKTHLPFIDLPWIAGAYTPAEDHSPQMAEAVTVSNELIGELFAADQILIATPMYNFSTPAILKAYIDHIVRFNVTFNAKYEGLVNGKHCTLIIASGGVYTPGAFMESWDRETSYLKMILGFIGITDIDVILAGGSNQVAQGEISQQELVASFRSSVLKAVK